MEYRNLGKSGLKLSELSYGSWVTFHFQVDEKLAADLLKTAYDAVVNFFYNAEAYANGESEIIMGRALKKLGLARDTYCISSKVFWGGGGSIYRGDIIDMIVWATDFRFVWAPRNVNVNRWGIDVWSEAKLSLSTHLLSISANYSMVKVTYDRPDPVPVQVMYRPRHSGAGSLGFTSGKWEGQVGVKFIGSRFPVAFHVNQLPAFWTTEFRGDKNQVK